MKSQTRITIYGRLAFPVLDEAKPFPGMPQSSARYSASIIVEPGSPSDKEIRSALRAAAAEKWGEAKADAAVKALSKALKIAYVDGDTKPDLDGYPGNWILQAHAKANKPPRLVVTRNGVNETLDRTTQGVIYAGCYVNAIVEIWAQDNQYGKRLNASIAGLQFVKDGDAFGGGRPASEDEFEVVEEAETPDFGTSSDEDDDFPPF